jgi:hypothetical protein
MHEIRGSRASSKAERFEGLRRSGRGVHVLSELGVRVAELQ